MLILKLVKVGKTFLVNLIKLKKGQLLIMINIGKL